MRIHFSSVSINGQKYKDPTLLRGSSSDEKIEKVIDYFESHLGQTEENLDRHYLMNLFEPRLLGRTVSEVMKRWFYDPKGLDYNKEQPPSEIRKQLFKFMTKQKKNWVNRKNREQLLEKFSDTTNIGDSNNLEMRLFGDHKKYYRIIRRGEKPTAQEVIKRVNTEIIRYIFSRANEMWYYLPRDKLNAELVKSLVRNAKLWNILINFEYEHPINENQESSKKIKIEAIGPQELVGRSTKYGQLLYALFHSTLELIDTKIHLFLDIEYFDQNLQVAIPIFEIPSLLPVKETFDKNLESDYDSEVEKQFAKEFQQRFPHWDLQHEEVLMSKDRIFVPDFLLTYRGKEIYLEIVGFWTDRYLRKKVEKLKYFSQIHDNIVVLVDIDLEFPQDIVPTFVYDKNFPLNDLEKHLTEHYETEAFQSYLKKQVKQKDKIISQINKKLKNQPIIRGIQVQNILQAKSKQETKQVLGELFGDNKEIHDEDLPAKTSFHILSDGLTIIKHEILNSIQQRLIKIVPEDGITRDELIKQLNNSISTDVVSLVLKDFGYKEVYSSLIDVVVYPPPT